MNQPPERSYVDRMALGVLAGTGGLVWTRLSGLIAVALLVRSLGLQLYGVWAIADLLIISQGLVDLGILGATTRYVSQAEARGDPAMAWRVIRLSLLWYLGISALYAAVVLPLLPSIPGWLGVAPAQAGSARLLLGSTAASFLLSNVAYVFVAALQGQQRMATVYLVQSATRVVYVAMLGLTLALGWNAGGVVAATLVMYAVLLVWFIRETRRSLPRGAEQRERLDVREFLGFGALSYLSNLGDLVMAYAPKLVAAVALGAVGAAEIDLAYRIPLVAYGFIQPLLFPVLPAAARLVAIDRRGDLALLAGRVSRYVAVLSIPIGVVTVCFGPDLVQLWTGVDAAGIATVVRVLGAGLILQALALTSTATLTGAGSPGAVAGYKLVMIGVGLSGMIVGVHRGGLVGIGVGVVAGFAVSAAYLAVWPLARFGHGLWTSQRVGMTPPLLALAGGAAVGAITAVASQRLSIGLELTGVATLVGYAALLRPTRSVTGEDLRLLRVLRPGRAA